MKQVYYSVFVFSIANGWEKVAEIKSTGLMEIAVREWRKIYGKGCVHAYIGKNHSSPDYSPTDIYGQSAFEKPE